MYLDVLVLRRGQDGCLICIVEGRRCVREGVVLLFGGKC